MAQTMTEWVQELEKHDLLQRVVEEVPIEQIASSIYANNKKATLFENIAGYDMPLVANTFSNRAMIQLALQTDEEHCYEVLNECRQRFIKPVEVQDAPCQEIVIEGEDVNLADFPLHVQHELDGAPYISASVAIAKDPSRDVYNLGIYRMMYRTRNQTGVDVTAAHKLRYYYQQACEMGKPLEVAIALGLPTLDLLASVASTPYDVDEYEVLGGFRNEPAELVKCRTVDLLVPANAEMIFECVMEPDGWVFDEGPYGEFTGTYAGGVKRNPKLRIKAITHRKGAMFHSATHGGPHIGWTDCHVIGPIYELDLLRALRAAGLDVKGVRLVAAAGFNWGVAKIKTLTKGDGKQAALAMLTCTRHGFPKFAVVVDEDIDIFDDEQVSWAMTWRTQPHKDVVIIDNMSALPLDPSLETSQPPVVTSKMAWDATIPYDRDRSDFERCYATPFIPDLPEKHAACTAEELDEKMLNLIGENGPIYFNDIMIEFHGLGHQNILEAFGRLREQRLLDRDDDGRYLLAGTGET